MKKIPIVFFLFCFSLLGCGRWSYYPVSAKYAQYGWQKTYLASDKNGSVDISLGEVDGSEIIAIDYYPYLERCRIRLYGKFNQNQSYEIRIMKFKSGMSVYITENEKKELWTNGELRKLFLKGFFKKLPEEVETRVMDLARKIDKEYFIKNQR